MVRRDRDTLSEEKCVGGCTMTTTTPVSLELKNVLVPVDFSVLSEPAVKLARAIAQQYGSTIYLANVIESFDVSGMSRGKSRKTGVESATTDFRFIETRYFSGVTHAKLVLDGDINLSLLRAIKEHDIDLVVMATRGAEGCERLLTGSVTEELFREAECPVLATGPNVKEEFGRFASLSKVLYPMETTPTSIAAIPYLVSLIDTAGSRVTLLHVVHPDIQSPSERQRIRDRLTSEMLGLFPEGAKRSIADVIVEFGPIAETIVEFSVARRADAIVLGVRHGGAFTRSATHIPWSIAHQIIAQAPCPVLTIRGDREGKKR